MFLSESDDLSGLICSISHDDLNSLDDPDSLSDLKNTKMQALYILSGFLGLGHLDSLFFLGLIIKNSIFYDFWHPLF